MTVTMQRIVFISNIVVVLILSNSRSDCCCLAAAFTVSSSAFATTSGVGTIRQSRMTTTAFRRFMSDIPNDSEQQQQNRKGSSASRTKVIIDVQKEIRKYEEEIVKNLPPKPEDMIVMIGDLLSLAVYGFFDHFISNDLMTANVNRANTPAKLSVLLEKFSPAASTAIDTEHLLSTPVWVDSAVTPNLSQIYQITVSDQIVTHYSPLLQQTGLAVTILASCWLLSGWFHEAFLYKHTLLCRTDDALVITAKTWLTCSLLLFTLTAFSHYVCGCDSILSYTRGDIDFIVDSLSVLTMWRFLVSSLLGTGGSK
jgi:hypothetical protein